MLEGIPTGVETVGGKDNISERLYGGVTSIDRRDMDVVLSF